MKHRISIKEDTKGFYSIYLNGRAKAYGLTIEQAEFFYKGIAHGIEESGHKVEFDDAFFSIFILND